MKYTYLLMEKAEIKAVADYLKDLEEGLYEWDYRGLPTLYHLPKLCKLIKQLMDEAFQADQELKPVLAVLEYKARRCKQCIERRLAVRN